MSFLTVSDAIAMGYITEKEAAGMGELGKKKKSFLKRLKKLAPHNILKKISPIQALKKVIAPKKKKAAAPGVEEPASVVPADASSMPTVVPLTPSPIDQPIQTMSVPGPGMPTPSYYGGGGSSAPYSSGGTSSMPVPSEEIDLPEEEVDIDEEVPQFTNPRREQAGARGQQMRFVDNQTDPELNEEPGRPPGAEESVDGLGWVIKSTPGYKQKSIIPKRTFANTFDQATNPRRKKKSKRDEWGRHQVVLSKAAHGVSSRRKKNPQMSGILPETTQGNVGLGVVGGIAFAASDLVPASMRPIVKAGALGAMLWGGFKALTGIFGGSSGGITESKRTLPPNQKISDVAVAGAFVKPGRGASVRLAALNDSYPLTFSVRNRGDQPISVDAIIQTEEFPRGGGEKASSQKVYSLDLQPGQVVTKDDREFPFGGGTFNLLATDVNATLIIKRSQDDAGITVASASWVING